MSEADHVSINDFSASARLSFTQFLRKGAPNRSSSHEHDSRNQLSSVNAAALLAFSSGKSSPLANDSSSQPASRLFNLGGSRVQLSPLQSAVVSSGTRRRARTLPRDFQAGVKEAVERGAPQAKLGAFQHQVTTLS